MNYLNDILALVGLILLTIGIVCLWGYAVACLAVGGFCLSLALFNPLIEAIRGNHAIKEITYSEGEGKPTHD